MTLLWKTAVKMQERCTTESLSVHKVMVYSAVKQEETVEERQRMVVVEKLREIRIPFHFHYTCHVFIRVSEQKARFIRTSFQKLSVSRDVFIKQIQ